MFLKPLVSGRMEAAVKKEMILSVCEAYICILLVVSGLVNQLLECLVCVKSDENHFKSRTVCRYLSSI